jgi:hypothetical protein
MPASASVLAHRADVTTPSVTLNGTLQNLMSAATTQPVLNSTVCNRQLLEAILSTDDSNGV